MDTKQVDPYPFQEYVNAGVSSQVLVRYYFAAVNTLCAEAYDYSDEAQFAMNELERWMRGEGEVPAQIDALHERAEIQARLCTVNRLISLAWTNVNREKEDLGSTLVNYLGMIAKENSESYIAAFSQVNNLLRHDILHPKYAVERYRRFSKDAMMRFTCAYEFDVIREMLMIPYSTPYA